VNRRVFLKGIALASLAAAGGGLPRLAAAQPPANSLAGLGVSARDPAAPPQLILGRLLRGTAHGQVQESRDGGGTWRKIADFGAHCSVARLYEQQSEIQARIELLGHGFTLRSADGRLWRTADAARRAA
jgi:hypothetical protein